MLTVDDLRCEYLPAPLGVDTAEPRFSWKLADSCRTRGQRQTAWQVVVEGAGRDGREPLWDSGKVATDTSVNVAYAGRALRSSLDCRWRVRVWDKDGQPTDWSEEARFSVGLLDAADWQGHWIACAQAEAHQHVWFRQTFTLESMPSTAFVFLCSIGYHELYVNGQRIGDAVLTPGVTNLERRALYMTYDVASALQPGENVIAVWTGPGWARADGSYGKGVWEQQPMFRCQMHLDGGAAALVTDEAWLCRVSSSENIGLWKGGGQGTYGGELIDARRHIADWNQSGCDLSGWLHAERRSQSLELSSALFEPDRKVEALKPVAIRQTDDGGWRVDMGRNYTGWLELRMRGGKEGERVVIQTANREEATREYDQESIYIFDQTGAGTSCHRFNWMAGRWITIQGLPCAPSYADITGYVVTNDRKRIGQFACSDPLLNQIYETDLRTYISNTVNGVVMDCPHRERYGYGEVALACTWGCGIPNYESAAFYTKCLRDWCDVQSPDGMVNTIAPQPYLGAGGTLWSSAPVTMSREMLLAYGDKRLLARAYPVMKRWLDYLNAAVTADGVLMPYAKTSRFLGDWATPHGSEYGDKPEAQLFNNCVYAYDLDAFIQAARLLGHVEDVPVYTQRLAALREHAHRYFYNEQTGLYVDGLQLSMLFPLYTRITPEPLRGQVFERFAADLAEKGYMDTGSPGMPIMLKYVIEDLGRPELLYPCLMRTTFPGYGFFISRGETAWPEYWEIDGIDSRIHTCYTSIAGYFIKGIGGIQSDPAAPGMQRFVMKPAPVDGLAFANTTSSSLYGPITSNWSRSGDAVTYSLEIPPNTVATLHLRGACVERLTENGTPVGEADGVTVKASGPDGVVLEVQAGAYRFVAA